MILGIDPSLRHTGLCLLSEGTIHFIFREIKSTQPSMLLAVQEIRRGVRQFLLDHDALGCRCFSIEKQLSVGGHTSSTQFYVQMAVLETVRVLLAGDEPVLIMPMPVQLRSYVQKVEKAPAYGGRSYVDFFREKYNHPQRISEHCVDAFFLAKLALDVTSKRWYYKLPEKEAPLHPWRTHNGIDT